MAVGTALGGLGIPVSTPGVMGAMAGAGASAGDTLGGDLFSHFTE